MYSEITQQCFDSLLSRLFTSSCASYSRPLPPQPMPETGAKSLRAMRLSDDRDSGQKGVQMLVSRLEFVAICSFRYTVDNDLNRIVRFHLFLDLHSSHFVLWILEDFHHRFIQRFLCRMSSL